LVSNRYRQRRLRSDAAQRHHLRLLLYQALALVGDFPLLALDELL
jgi:hypothetical protein